MLHSLFDIQVSRFDKPAERCFIDGRPRSNLHMPHKLAAPSQQPSRISQRRPLKKPQVRMRRKHIHIPESSIAQASGRAAVMQNLPHLVPAAAHHLKPSPRKISQFPWARIHPGFDGRIAHLSPIQSKHLSSNHRSTIASGFMLPAAPAAGTKEPILVHRP